jgi:hypothetical protein
MTKSYARHIHSGNKTAVRTVEEETILSRLVRRIIWAIFGFFIISSACFAQPKTTAFELKIKFLPESEHEAAIKMSEIRGQLIANYTKGKIKYDEKSLNKLVKQEYADSLTLEDFIKMMTPESKVWFEQFFNNFRGKALGDFETFYNTNRKKTIKEIRLSHKKASQSKKAPEHANIEELAPCANAGDPYNADIIGSMMIIRNAFDCQKRHVITTPDQELYLRGRYDNSQPPYFPSYSNIYCDACCGPAAGQSLLEWFNVPVNKSDGTVATSPYDIQKKLADEMETKQGFDFTYPGDLASTLEQEKYEGARGHCYQDGDGSIGAVHYMLSLGSPVILLIAEDYWAHYLTVYGYDQSRKIYYTANGLESNPNVYDAARLEDLWNFANIGYWADVAYDIVGVNSNTMFTYAHSGCGVGWSYSMSSPVVEDQNNYPGMSIFQIYYAKFNDQYVKSKNSENYMDLNFYADINTTLGVTNSYQISSGGRKISLVPGNNHVIDLYAAPVSDGTSPNVKVDVGIDKTFLDTYGDVQCTFNAYRQGFEGLTLGFTHSDKCKNYVNPSSSQANIYNYDLQYSFPYHTYYKTLDFVLHGGFRTAEYEFPTSVLGLKLERTYAPGLGVGAGMSICHTQYANADVVTAFATSLAPTAVFTDPPAWQLWAVPTGEAPSGTGISVPTDPGQVYDGGWFTAHVSPTDSKSLVIGAAGGQYVVGPSKVPILPGAQAFYVIATGHTNTGDQMSAQLSFPAGTRDSSEDECTSPLKVPAPHISQGDPAPDTWINDVLVRAVLTAQYLEVNNMWHPGQPFPDRLNSTPVVELRPISTDQQTLVSSLKAGPIRDTVNDFFSLKNGKKLSKETIKRVTKFLNLQSLVSFK